VHKKFPQKRLYDIYIEDTLTTSLVLPIMYDIYIADTLTTSPVLPIRVQSDPKGSLMISLWITYIVADIHVHALKNNINGCELVLEEAHYCIFLVSQQCGIMFVNFI
jgi:hypothetical protein